MNPNQNSNKKRVTFASSEAIKKMMDPALRNSLASGFGARSSLATNPSGQHNSLASRPSAAAGSGRGSLYNVGHEVAKRIPALVKPSLKDNRNLNSAKVVTELCNKIFDFLVRNEASFPYTEKTVRKPSGKTDFKNMFEFLFRRIDDKYILKAETLEAEVPKLLTALGYPYGQIKSHHMQPLGASHSWPAVLGALAWLIDVIETTIMIGRASKMNLHTAMSSPALRKMLMEKLPKSQQEPVDFSTELSAFRELLMKEQNIEEDYRELVQRRNDNENAIEQVKKDIEEDKEKIRDLELDSADLASDISRLREYTETVLVSISRVEENIIADEAGISKLLENLVQIEDRNEKKETLIQSQTMTGDEARSLILKRRTLKEQLSSARAALHKAEMKFYELHPKFFKESGTISADYQTFLSCLQEFCRSLNSMGDLDEIDWSLYSYDLQSDRFINESRKELTELMESLREKVAETIEKLRQNHAELDIQLDNCNREVLKLEDRKMQKSLENNMRLQQKSRENDDKTRMLHSHKKELELIRSRHNKASGELNEQNIINDDLHDKYLKTQSLYLDQRGALEKSYNDYVTDVMDSTAKLYTKFNDLMKQKLELKQRAEDILDRNQKELAESKKPNETFDMK